MPTSGAQLNVMIDEDKREAFKNKVRGQGKTVNEVINEFIDQYLLSDNIPNQSNLDKIVNEAVAEQLGKVIGTPALKAGACDDFMKGNVSDGVGYVTLDEVKSAIADSLDPMMMKLEALQNQIKAFEGEGGEYHVDVESSPPSEGEGITATTLAPIFDDLDSEPITDSTPSNEDSDSLIEEKLDRLLSEIEGQSDNVTENNTASLFKQDMQKIFGCASRKIDTIISNAKKAQRVKGHNPVIIEAPNGDRYRYELIDPEQKNLGKHFVKIN